MSGHRETEFHPISSQCGD